MDRRSSEQPGAVGSGARRSGELLRSALPAWIVGLCASALALSLVGVPWMRRARAERAERRTEEQLQGWVSALRARYHLAGAVPGTLEVLLAGAPPSEGRLDGWGRPLVLEVGPERVTVASLGEDGRRATDDDRERILELGWLRREETLERIRDIHSALVRYVERSGQSAPLPGDWPSALERLVGAGLLPERERYAVDAWGAPLVEWPRGLAPVVRVRSSSLTTQGEAAR